MTYCELHFSQLKRHVTSDSLLLATHVVLYMLLQHATSFTLSHIPAPLNHTHHNLAYSVTIFLKEDTLTAIYAQQQGAGSVDDKS